MNIRQKLTLALLSTAVWLPHSALACSVCFSAREETRVAFYLTTALLTGLPLLMLGSFVFWYRKRIRQFEGDGPFSEPTLDQDL